jgi:hypothetical protein
VRPLTVLAHRWPLGVAGVLIGVHGSLVTLILWLGSQGHFALLDQQIDLESRRDTAVALEVEPLGPLGTSAGDYVKVLHEFTTPRGNTSRDWSYVPRRGLEPGDSRPPLQRGDSVEIEYHSVAPYRSRIVGGSLSPTGLDYWRPALYGLTIPGGLLTLLWALALLRHRRLLRDGDLAIAEVLCVAPVRRANSQILRVHFRFRDHQAQLRDGSHRILTRSPLGERLQQKAREHRCVVVHDRHDPRRNLLVTAADFLPARTELIGIDLSTAPPTSLADGQLPDGHA